MNGLRMVLRISFPLLAAAVLAAASSAAPRQEAAKSGAKPAWPAANPKDVESIDAIMAAVYDVISGPPGERNWDRMRPLFVPDARLIPVHKNQDGTFVTKTLTLDDYIAAAGKYFKENAFYEREAARKTEQYGHIAHVFSTYESRHAPDAKPFDRGINSFQLFFDGKRWWCVTIYWDAESLGTPIPEKYLHQ